MMDLSKLSGKLSLNNLVSIIQRSGGYLLVVLFNVGDQKSRKKTLPLSKKLWGKFPNLNIVGVHVQEGEKDYLPGQILSVVKENEIPYEIYMDGETEKKKKSWSIIPQWILFDRHGQQVRSFSIENEPDLKEIEDYLNDLNLPSE